MKYIKTYSFLFIIVTVFWCVLNESFSLNTIVVSLPVSLITIFLVHTFFSGEYYATIYVFPLFTLLKYFFVLVINIYKSSLDTIICILKGNVNPIFINIQTNNDNPWFRSLIANSITMTPGTVSVILNDKNLLVLWLNPITFSTDEAGDIIKGVYEDLLVKERKKC